MILLIDNYDSFVFNLARYIQRLGLETRVVRNDAISVEEIRKLRPQAIVLSPGPGIPERAGICVELVQQLHQEFPILGICLGHQAIASALGGRIVRAKQPMHGRTSEVWHDDTALFCDVPQQFEACRYHSLVVKHNTLPRELADTARCEDGTIMAIEHAHFPVAGLQFHPEAILTSCGYRLLHNFLKLAGINVTEQSQDLQLSEMNQPKEVVDVVTDQPVTF